jgi:tRNA G18 (ribose-2'-O)-methylase SpoU
MGYVSKLKLHIYKDIFQTLEALKADGYKIFAAEATPVALLLSKVKVPQKWVLLMGHEGKGISKEVLSACDEVVSIEMSSDVKSFNVSVAASIIMYQFSVPL